MRHCQGSLPGSGRTWASPWTSTASPEEFLECSGPSDISQNQPLVKGCWEGLCLLSRAVQLCLWENYSTRISDQHRTCNQAQEPINKATLIQHHAVNPKLHSALSVAQARGRRGKVHNCLNKRPATWKITGLTVNPKAIAPFMQRALGP